MHDSEQEHSSITGCRVTYESTIFYNEANKFSIIVVKTSDPRIPPQACSGRYYGDRMLRFTAVGYELPRTKAVELELDGEWVESKYGYQLQVEQWQEIVPQTADGLLAYLGSGLIKGIGPKTAEDIVATFGPDTLNILDNEPEKLLQSGCKIYGDPLCKCRKLWYANYIKCTGNNQNARGDNDGEQIG